MFFVENLTFKNMANKDETKSEGKNKSAKNGLSSNEYKGFFWYVLISTILIIVLLFIIYYKICNDSYEFSFHFQDTIPVILTVLGVFIAFTAINMYSIFNSRINDERRALKQLNDKYEDQIQDLKNKYKRFEDIANNLRAQYALHDIENSLRDIVDNNVPIVERTTAILKLIRLIEDAKKNIRNPDLKLSESNDLEGKFLILKIRVRSRIQNKEFKRIKNNIFQKAFKKLIDLSNEENNISN